MSEQKRPEPGEWWGSNNESLKACFFVTPTGSMAVEYCDGEIGRYNTGQDWSGWHHLPGCTGWDWVEHPKPDPLAQRIMAAWMRLQGHSEDQIAETDVGSIEDEVLALETVVVVKTEAKPVVSYANAAPATFTVTPAEQWPKWYVHATGWTPATDGSVASYVRRDGPTTLVRATIDGKEWPPRDGSDIDKHVECGAWVEVTEAEAKSRVTQSLSTCPDCGEFRGHGHEDVCPMAWVMQDLAPGRVGHDEIHWSDWPEWRWVKLVSKNQYRVHGEKTGEGSVCSIRCRRKDLPPMPMPMNTIDKCPLCGEVRGRDYEHVCRKKVTTIDVDPGEGFRWLENSETVLPTDEIFMPDRNPVWVLPGDGPFRNAGYHGWDVRRAILNPTRKSVRLFADSKTRQVIACFGDGKDSAHKWAIDDVEIHYDGTQFYVEVS